MVPYEGSTALPCTPSGAALRLAERFGPKEPGEGSWAEIFSMMIYGDQDIEAAEKTAGMWLGFVFWLVLFAITMLVLVGLAWATSSAEPVLIAFKVLLGALFGDVVLWGVRWSLAVAQQRKLGDEAAVRRVPRGWPEWAAMVAGAVSFLVLLQ